MDMSKFFYPQSFSGHPDEDWKNFEGLIASSALVNGIVDELPMVALLKLKLTGSALNFFNQLGLAEVDTFVHATAAMRARYENINRAENTTRKRKRQKIIWQICKD